MTPTVRQVLYATDLSPASRPAWERAQQLGTLFDAEVLVLHVLSPVTAYDWMGSLALLPLGYVVAGPLGERFGSTEVLIGGSLLALVSLSSALTVRDVRALRRLERA